MKLCPKCGTQYPDEANFCPIDAARLPPATVARERSGANGPAATAPGFRPAAAPVAEARTPDGRRLLGGRFALGNRIGGRQTGEVYEAVDQSTGQTCVLKLIDAEVFPSNLVMQRTERELGKLARLDATGIARILDYGRVNGRMWVACERLPASRSLLDIVFDEGPMSPQRAAAILLDVGKALSEAARVGIIHRDLAPKNVLLGADGSVKLINFGVAVPATSKVQGVPEFVAPEIVEGKPVDQRANIYSLGALFYYLVAGRPPYMGDPEDVYAQHLSAEAEPPSTHLDSIPDAVDAVILRALARSSSRRFMTLRQLLNDIERIAAGEEPATASAAMGALMPARGKGKAKKLAQTMVGGYQVAHDAARSKQAEAGAVSAAGQAGVVSSGTAGAAQGRGAAPAGHAGNVEVAVEVSGTIGGQEGAGTASAAAGDDAGARADEVSESAASAGAQGRAGFRETKWFKEGAAAAEGADGASEGASDAAPAGTSGSASGSALGGTSGRARPGEAARDDREKYSLQTGATDVMASVRATKAASDDVSSRELIDEMKGGRGKIVAAIVIAIVLAAVLIVYAVTSG